MAEKFAEVRIEPALVIYGTQGGAGFSTNIVVVNSGHENRNKNWAEARGKWEFGERKLLGRELHSIQGFFRLRHGSYQGFRFKDWSNYKATAEPLTEWATVSQGVLLPVGVSTTEAQLWKKMWDTSTALSDTTEFHKISKPIIETVPRIFRNGTEATFEDEWDIDQSTGIVTFVVPFDPEVDELTWEGEFDIPVRFDTDDFKARFDSGVPVRLDDGRIDMSEVGFYLFSLPIVELRV